MAPHDGCDLCPALESISHLLLRCQAANGLWSKMEILDLVAIRSISIIEFVHSREARDRFGQSLAGLLRGLCGHAMERSEHTSLRQQALDRCAHCYNRV